MSRCRSVAWLVMLGSCTLALAGGDEPAGPAGPGPVLATDQGRIRVKFRDRDRVRLRPGGLVSVAGSDLAGLRGILADLGDPEPVRLVTRSEEAIDAVRVAAERRSSKILPDMNAYYEIVVSPDRVDAALMDLNALTVVQTAYRAPVPVSPPVDIPPTTPSFEPQQGYLDSAPGGIDAREAWNHPGGRGQGVLIIDIEYDWNDTHEDLESALGQELCYVPNGNFTEHGTAVLGEMGGADNGYGVTGAVPDATFGMVTQDPVGLSNSVSRAISCATPLMGPGDVMLLETQADGPLGLLPSEWVQDVFDAVSIATAAGITVVAAAGNGSADLDDPAHGGLFNRAFRDSGAIIVGAGAPPGTGQPDRSRLSFSTYGSRVDVQGWGGSVTTAGYGGLFDGGGDPDQYYTSTFSGTSSASPIVASAAAALQGIRMAAGAPPLDPILVRQILTDSGSPQQGGPFGAGNIGPRPNLGAAIDALADLVLIDVVVEDTPPLGDGDGFLEPGETATLRATVENIGSQTATFVTGLMDSDEQDVRVTVPEADWPDLAPATSAESLSPHHRVTLQPGGECGATIPFSIQLVSTPYEDLGGFGIEIGNRDASFPATNVPIEIPKSDAVGVTTTLDINDDEIITAVRVAVDITHGDIGELLVALQSPANTSILLHNGSGAGTANLVTTYGVDTLPDLGSLSDFIGESSAGTWRLILVDDTSGPIAAGTLNGWAVELTSTGAFDCDPLSCAEPVPGEVGDSLTVNVSGADDIELAWTPLGGVPQYRVWRSGSPDMDPDVVIGETAGASWVEVGGLSGAAPGSLAFYRVRAVNVCEWEGP
jgi:subtilisin-like proprotein convertase family protein